MAPFEMRRRGGGGGIMKLLSIPELIRRVLIFTRTLNMPLLDTLRPPLFTTWTSPNRQWGFSMGIIKDYSSCAVGLFLFFVPRCFRSLSQTVVSFSLSQSSTGVPPVRFTVFGQLNESLISQTTSLCMFLLSSFRLKSVSLSRCQELPFGSVCRALRVN